MHRLISTLHISSVRTRRVVFVGLFVAMEVVGLEDECHGVMEEGVG